MDSRRQHYFEQEIKNELNKLQIEKLEKEINQMKWQIEQDRDDEEAALREIEELKRIHEDLLNEHHSLSVFYQNPPHRLQEPVEPRMERRVPQKEIPLRDIYRPRDKTAFMAYIFDNKICINDFLSYYSITVTDTGDGSRCNGYHKYRGIWHASEMREKIPLKYSKFAALCQVTHELYDRGRMEEARKLYRAIIEDKDGFFSSEVAPIE